MNLMLYAPFANKGSVMLSVAPLIGEAIRRTHLNESINDLFNHE